MITLLLGLLVSNEAASREVDPALIEMRVGLQCDAAANRAFVRLGGLDVGMPGQFIDLPPEAPRSTARIIDAFLWQDAVCRLRDGTEVRLRVFRSINSWSRCTPHYITLWVGARRVLMRTGVGQCGERSMREWDAEASPGRLGWLVSPSRLDVCVRTQRHTAGPPIQCRLVGDPRLMGIRDWVEYQPDGSHPKRGRLYAEYAVDAGFCAQFIARGKAGGPDALVVPWHFARPVFTDHQAWFDLDNDGRPDTVRWWHDWFGFPPHSYVGIVPLLDAEVSVHNVRDVFFHHGKPHLLVDAWPSQDGPSVEAGWIQEGLKGGIVCRFRRVGDDEDR